MAKIDSPTREAKRPRPSRVRHVALKAQPYASHNDSTAAERFFNIPSGWLKNRSLSGTMRLGFQPPWRAAMGVNIYRYIFDRVSKKYEMPSLAEMIMVAEEPLPGTS